MMGHHMRQLIKELEGKKMSNQAIGESERIQGYDENGGPAPRGIVSGNVNEGIDATLAERGSRYGSYMEKAFIIQDIKKILRGASSWEKMDPDMRESLEMVVHKIGRIVTGDPEYLDSWTDVIGYTKLVEDRLKGVAR